MGRRGRLFASCIAMIGLFSPVAQAQVYRMTLVGANENPPVNSPGTGTAVITVNTATHEMHVVSTFSGLVAPTTASHSHCCAAPTANAGVATTTPSFVGFPLGVTSGSMDRVYDTTLAGSWNAAFITANGGTTAGAEAAFVAGANAGLAYLNIHSSTFPGGEIRGTLQRYSFVNAGLDARVAGAAAGLDSLGAGTGAVNNAIVGLAMQSLTQQASALERIAPTASTGLEMTTAENIRAGLDQAGARLDGLRAYDAAVGGVWGKLYGVKAEQDPSDGYAGHESDGWGVAAGVDGAMGEGMLVGAAINYANRSVDWRDQLAGNSDEVDSTQLTVYASHVVTNSAYLDGALSYAWHSFDTSRDPGVGGLSTASFDGSTFALRVGAGAPMGMGGGAVVTPQAKLDWYKLKRDAYAETGGPMSLNVASADADRIQLSVGADIEFEAGGVQPFVRGFWNHDFKNEGVDVTSSFTSGGASFTTPGQELEQDMFTAGAGLNFGGDMVTGGVAYDATLGKDYKAHVFQARAMFRF